jgi:hypothetical protein
MKSILKGVDSAARYIAGVIRYWLPHASYAQVMMLIGMASKLM